MVSLREIRKIDEILNQRMASYKERGLGGKFVLMYRSGNRYVDQFFGDYIDALSHFRGLSGGAKGQTYNIRKIPV
jgi:hypothetical protein